MDHPEYDTICRCPVCGREEHIRFLDGLQQGWPRCHDQDMPITQTWADIPRSFHQAMHRQARRSAEALRRHSGDRP